MNSNRTVEIQRLCCSYKTSGVVSKVSVCNATGPKFVSGLGKDHSHFHPLRGLHNKYQAYLRKSIEKLPQEAYLLIGHMLYNTCGPTVKKIDLGIVGRDS